MGLGKGSGEPLPSVAVAVVECRRGREGLLPRESLEERNPGVSSGTYLNPSGG